ETIVHWYKHLPGEPPKRILYVLRESPVFDDRSDTQRFQVQKHPTESLYGLTIQHLTPRDSGTYYCAYWLYEGITVYYNKVFGSGTKLIVSDKVQSQPSNFEILQKKHKNQMMYVCLIENFYPEVIRVTWTDGENQKITENVVKGEAWRPTEEDKYSISSWLTVPEDNKDKKYFCSYEHESGTGNSILLCLMFVTDHLYHRAAYLVYIVLLLKSSMYYLIVLFFIYR
ncbi:IGL1 protein, partial [Glareola pratincola]|nr:IGL1 protein [Glareola pratincola]